MSIANTRWIPSTGMSAISSPVIANRIARNTQRPPRIAPTTARNPPIHLVPLTPRNRAAIASMSTLATASTSVMIDSENSAMCRTKMSLNSAPNAKYA